MIEHHMKIKYGNFATLEQESLTKAQCLVKDRDRLKTSQPIKLNGGLIQLDGDAITLTQERQCKNLKLVLRCLLRLREDIRLCLRDMLKLTYSRLQSLIGISSYHLRKNLRLDSVSVRAQSWGL